MIFNVDYLLVKKKITYFSHSKVFLSLSYYIIIVVDSYYILEYFIYISFILKYILHSKDFQFTSFKVHINKIHHYLKYQTNILITQPNKFTF